jgi:ribonucleoside-diphosphate reductase alpha chain
VADPLQSELARYVWETRYRAADVGPPETGIEATWQRVAAAVAAIEREPKPWGERFLGALRDFRFLPGGRILAGAGTRRQVTLFNCFVMGEIDDSMEGIFDALRDGAVTMQQGGGVGYDFSTLRPRGSRARRTGMIASGPVSFLRVWDTTCATILSSSARRGAMMATLRCDHPDIEEFIVAKRPADALSYFNLSVLVTDEFMRAVREDREWRLVFPQRELETATEAIGTVQRAWSGRTAPVACQIHRTLPARALWQRLCACAGESAEPGILFIDRINAANNLGYCETLSATNPCGEVPLPPWGACNLGSVNLTAFVREPGTARASLDLAAIADTARVAVRFLDNVIDISAFPLARQRAQAHRSRRIGLGVTGLADALTLLGLRYDSEHARQTAAQALRSIRDAAYETSTELAREKGVCPAFQADAYLQRPFIRALPPELRAAIRRGGIRNSHLTALAPAGSISLLANDVSSGIEPSFGAEVLRRVRAPDGQLREFRTANYACALWRALHPGTSGEPPAYVDGALITPRDHLLMQAALQPFVDSAISKTIPLGASVSNEDIAGIFADAYELGLKGCTVYRSRARPAVVEKCCETDLSRVAAGTSI